ncbi:MAG: D-aminoacylase [Nitrospirae bacterium]|nr:D-aminoacylase [Nitrospirota bacterium]
MLKISNTEKTQLDLLIKAGQVYDGRGSEPFIADIGIKNSLIVFVSKKTKESFRSKKVISAKGFSVSPGFIDTHSHSEFTLLSDPRAEGKLYQGITTEINGNCGLSAGPLLGDAFKQRQSELKELGIKERWADLEQYLSMLEKTGLAINFVTLVGHGNLRASVMGYEDRKPKPKEMRAMKKLLEGSLKAGAIGLSTGLIYPPGVYSDTDEIAELVRSGKTYHPFIYTSHMRSEGNRLIEAIQEVIDIGENRTKVHISHIKTAGKKNWHKSALAISLLDKARAKGISLTCDRYPYIAGETDLDSILPSWALEGGNGKVLKRLKNPEIKRKIRNEILSEHPDTQYYQAVRVSTTASEKNKWMEGKSLADIAKKLRMEAVDCLFYILINERLRAGGIFYSMSEENLRRFLKLPFCMLGSDSSARSTNSTTHKGKVHPRGFGTFPRFLRRYVNELRLMSMPEAIHKLTMLPAKTFGLKKRGQITEGFRADIVVFDENKISDRATFDEPYKKAEGILHVIVNGVPVLDDRLMTGEMPGRVLRHGA